MYLDEDLIIKISETFHNEINPVLTEIDNDVNDSFWFARKSIKGKFFIIKNLLLGLTVNDITQYQIINLLNIIKRNKSILQIYFESYNIATCFFYIWPENTAATTGYFVRLNDFGDYDYKLKNGHIHMIGLEVIGFPNDCSFKLTAKFEKDDIIIKKQREPLFPIESEKGKHIGNIKRTRKEQIEVEEILRAKNYDFFEKGENDLLVDFKKFARKILEKRNDLLRNFDECIDLCNLLIDSKLNDITHTNLPEIEKIYTVLKNGYIKEPFEKFLTVFSSDYSGPELIWLKTGTELKYFIDRLNEKLNLSNEINKWTGTRFQLLKPVKNMTSYLSKQTKGEYQLLIQGNLRKNPLYKLFRE